MRQFNESQIIPLRPDYLTNAVAEVFRRLGWSYQMTSPSQFTANASMSFTSWGENITVEIFQNSLVKVESKCAMPFQLVDWGKNKENVQTFFAHLRMVANVG